METGLQPLAHGLAEVLVLPIWDAGEIKLTARAGDLKSTMVVVQTKLCTTRPSMP